MEHKNKYLSAEAKLQENDLALAREYSDCHASFDDAFITSLEVQFREKHFLTDKQHQALQKVIKNFRMLEWAEENGVL